MKKSIFVLLFSGILLSFGGCKPAMNKALEGKEGLFAVLDTSKGEIAVELFYKETPLTVTNFVGLAEGTLDATKGKKFYNGLKFHRVISKANGDGQDFMIQGGDPKGNGTGGPGYKFPDEFVDSLTFDKPGYLAMANSGPATNGSQFFITIVPTTWLNGKHTIFGSVVDAESQKVVNKMKTNDLIKSVTIYRLGSEAEKFTASQKDFDALLAKADEKAAEERKAKQEKAAAFIAQQIAQIEKEYPDFAKDARGIYYKTIRDGAGAKAGQYKNVSTHYTGKFLDGAIFDSSMGRDPLDFQTAAGKMIPGFDYQVQDMKVGEKRIVILPPAMAYGEDGYPGFIPGNAYLIFEIELVDIR